jgi:hypothetical protein
MPTDCARARESASAQLDGELTELELDRLETHLRFCPDCSAWADQVRDVTLRLREASFEVPAGRFVLPRPAHRWRVGSAVALTSAAALVATMFVAPARQQASLGSLRHVVLRVPAGQRIAVPRLGRLGDGGSAALSAPRPANSRPNRVAS